MMDEIIKDILYYLELHKDKVPRGYSLLNQNDLTDMQSVLLFLTSLFQAEEEAIQEEHKKRFVTDDYENGVRQFAIVMVRTLFPEYDALKTNELYIKLLTQRHMAYAYFHCLNDNLFTPDIPSADPETERQIYSGLIDFYDNFRGQFSDNEEAIELLCKYYPRTLSQKSDRPKLISALFAHISYAGSPGNRGYAYHGISLMKKYIGNLPLSIAMDLLQQYHIFHVTNDSVYRQQIHTIIMYSSIRNKRACKFRYLDSVLLLDRFSLYFVRNYTVQHSDAGFSEVLYNSCCAGQNISISMDPLAYWDSGKQKNRTFFLEGHPAAYIRLLHDSTTTLTIQNEKSAPAILEFPYSDDDWHLEQYYTADLGKELEYLISKTNHQYQMTFSLLYLDNYRGLRRQWIDFDHKFIYSDEDGIIMKNSEENRIPEISGFYGKAVHSLTCIVGKNGTGKTAIVDFLRESFFKLVRLIDSYGLPCEEGYVEEIDYWNYGILDENARFFIIFFMNDIPLFLTNIEDITCSCAKPFQSGRYDSNDLSKVVYFSNMLKNNQDSLFMVNQEKISTNPSLREKREIGRSLSLFRQIDYSETGSFIKRKQLLDITRNLSNMEPNPKNGINEELCYQFTLLKHMKKDKLCEYLDLEPDKEFKITSYIDTFLEASFTLNDLQNKDKTDELEKKCCSLPDAQIHHFSSGQYAKFAFLSKLYWFLEGYHKEHKRYKELFQGNFFPAENALQAGETVLLFIDEGETYYHPEWQRKYVSTLLEMIKQSKLTKGKTQNDRIQIVLTTNSPFILSDILLEDAVYLDKEKKSVFDRTLGQNIHTLLKENFFMSYTIGEYARSFIEDIMLCLQNPEPTESADRQSLQNLELADEPNYQKSEQPEQTDEPNLQNPDQAVKPSLRSSSLHKIRQLVRKYFRENIDLYTALRQLIAQIGEPVYRYELENLLEENNAIKEQSRLQRLLEEKKRIEAEISRLEEQRRAGT